jgi:hypothetical protein
MGHRERVMAEDSAKEDVIRGVQKAFHPDPNAAVGPGREISEEEGQGVPATDADAATPLGVGESTTRRGEDIAEREDEVGREHAGTKGESDRPYGKSAPEHSTGVNPSGPISEESPELSTGDQGG